MRASFRPVMFILTLIVALLVGARWGEAQSAGQFSATQQFAGELQVLSGPDIGFTVTGRKNGKPVGHLVVRVNGTWVEPAEDTSGRIVPAR